MTEHRFSETRGFPSSSLFLSGHFPGNPIVPGSILLSYLSARLRTRGLIVTRIGRVKFRRPLPPDVPIDVLVREHGGKAEVEVRDRAGLLVTGRLNVAAA